MKRFVTFLFILLGFLSQAQQEILIQFDDHKFKDGDRPAFLCLIPETTLDIVEKDFKKRVADITREKVLLSGYEWSFLGIDLKEFQNDTVEVTAAAYTKDDGVLVALGFTVDGEPYDFNTDERAKRQVESTLRGFSVEAYRDKVQMELNSEQDKLMSLDKMIKQSYKIEEEIIKSIKTKERKIESYRSDVNRIREERSILEKEILHIKEHLIKGNMDPEMKKQEEKRKKSLESEARGLDKQQEKVQSSIGDLEGEIRELEQEALVEERQELQSAYNDQELVVEQVEQKLSGIN